MLKLLRRFRCDSGGVTMVEYGLIAALISVTIIVAVTEVGTQLSSTFSIIQSRLSSANN